EIVDGGLAPSRFRTWILGSFAAIALLLAAISLYGALALLVTQRTREIGIRLAVGASPGRVARRVVRGGPSLTRARLVLGVLIALALTRLLSALVFGVGLIDPPSFVGGPVVLLLVGVAASVLPCWRATRVDPMVALRSE